MGNHRTDDDRPTTLTYGLPAKQEPLTPQRCKELLGDHCYERTGYIADGTTVASPPEHQERCKHCGDVRWAIPQHPWRYVKR